MDAAEAGGAAPRPGRFSRLVAGTFAVQVAATVLNALTGLFTARWLGPEGKGILALALLVPGLFGLLLGFGVDMANVYFAGSRRVPLRALAGNAAVFGLAGAALGLALAAGMHAAGALPAIVPGLSPALFWIGLASFPPLLLAAHHRGLLHGLQRIRELNWSAAAVAAVTLAATWAAVLGLGLGVTGALLAAVLGALLQFGVSAALLAREGVALAPRLDREGARETLRYGSRGYVSNLLQFVGYRLDMFFVNGFIGAAELGIYTISVRLAEMLWLLPNAVAFVIFSRSASARPGEMNALTPKALRVTLGASIAGAAALALAGGWVIRVALGADFAPATAPLLALLPGVVLLGGAKVLANDIAGRGRPGLNSISSGAGSVATVVLDLLLIPRHGALGAAIASSVSYALVFVLTAWFHRRVARSG